MATARPNIAPDVAYMQAHASDNMKVEIIVCSSFCAASSVLFVLARLWSRMLATARIHWSDWLIIFGLVRFSGTK